MPQRMVPLEAVVEVLKSDQAGDDAALLILDSKGMVLGGSPAAGEAGRRWAEAGAQDLEAALGTRDRIAWTSGPVGGEMIRLPGDSGAPLFLLRHAAVGGPAVPELKSVAAELENLVLHELRMVIQSVIAGAERLSDGSDRANDQIVALRELSDLAVRHVGVGLSLKSDDSSGLPRAVLLDLPRLVHNLVRQLKPFASISGRTLELEHSAFPAALLAPEGPIVALAQNMIGNALRHGSGDVRVRLEARPEGQGGWAIAMEVWQEGQGVTQEILDKLRRPWSGRVARGTSFGYGLEIERLAMILLAGRWDVVTTPDRSCLRAEFTLPEADPAPEDEEAEAPPAEIDLQAHRQRPLEGIGVLLVEDQRDIRDWITQVLRNAGAVVTAVSDAEGALLLVGGRPEPFDFALVDVGLPRMSGIALVRRMRATPRPAPPRHIFGLTGHGDAQTLEECREAGMEAVLQKPLQSSELRARLVEAVRKKNKEKAPRGAGTGTGAAGAPLLETPAFGGVEAELINPAVLSDLEAELGKEVALSFLQRAVEEAAETLHFLRKYGYGTETRPMLHATVGSTGITGLGAIERALRRIQRAGDDKALHAPAVEELEAAIGRTRALLV